MEKINMENTEYTLKEVEEAANLIKNGGDVDVTLHALDKLLVYIMDEIQIYGMSYPKKTGDYKLNIPSTQACNNIEDDEFWKILKE